VAFDVYSKFVGSGDIAGLLVDSLVYEATGQQAGSPSEVDMLVGSTNKIRGIHKYILAGERHPHIKDSDAWLFGKEFAQVMSGGPDIAYIASVASSTLSIRAPALWTVRLDLYGVQPTEAEKSKLTELLTKTKKPAETPPDVVKTL